MSDRAIDATTGQAPEPPTTSGARSARMRELVRSALARGGVLIAFAIMIGAFSLARPETFPTLDNAESILLNAAPGMIIALGLTVVLAMGDFDLSIGSMVGLAAGAAVAMMVDNGYDWRVVILLVLGIGAIVGVANGFLVAVLGGNSFIMTLGMATILTGVEYAFTSQAVVFQGVPSQYVEIGAGEWLGLSHQIWIALVVAVVLWVMLDATEPGRFMYAIGGNPEAARLSGIRTRTLRIVGFVIVALAATVVGILISSAGGGYTPNPGQYLLLPA
jgi:ribose transport system permease protein